jgi:hypothetical protein
MVHKQAWSIKNYRYVWDVWRFCSFSPSWTGLALSPSSPSATKPLVSMLSSGHLGTSIPWGYTCTALLASTVCCCSARGQVARTRESCNKCWCVFCHQDETIKHLFFQCRFARSIWSIILVTSSLYPSTSVANIFGILLQSIDLRFRTLIRVGALAVVWSLCLCRNDKVLMNFFSLAGYL